jgi:hypothetical protein
MVAVLSPKYSFLGGGGQHGNLIITLFTFAWVLEWCCHAFCFKRLCVYVFTGFGVVRGTLVLLCSLFLVSATFYIESFSTNFSSVDLQQNGL